MPALTTDQVVKQFIGAVKDEWQLYSDNPKDYTIGPPIGFGASSIVYSATFRPLGPITSTPCALKVVDLDRLPPQALHLLMQETQLMSLSKHPNVLRVRGTWMDGHKLYIALRLMNAGSAADVMRYAWPAGMEEEVVKCILKQALEGLNYLHINGLMHRDVKAANLLIDDDGTVLLGDLGVAAPLWETEESSSKRPTGAITSPPSPRLPRKLGKRKSFVGTPCWMAPEVIQGRQYDASADIWSFGITALELTQGHPPRSREPRSAVLTHIVTSPPPKLDRRSAAHSFSQTFVDIIESCLHKDPTKRPSAAELLATPFFKNAKKKGYLVGTVLKGLPPLSQRQERRKIPSLMTSITMESWDFGGNSVTGSVAGTPTTSIYGHFVKRGLSALPSGALSEVDDELLAVRAATDDANKEEGAAAYASRIRARNATGSRTHSRNISWAEPDDALVLVHAMHPDPIKEQDAPLSSSPESQHLLSDTSDEQTPVMPPALPAIPVAPQMDKVSASPPTSISSYTQGDMTTPTMDHEPIAPITPSSTAPTSKLWRKLVGHSRKESAKDGNYRTPYTPPPSKEIHDEEKEEKDGWGNGSESFRSRARSTIGKGVRNSVHMGAGIVRTMGRVTGGVGTK